MCRDHTEHITYILSFIYFSQYPWGKCIFPSFLREEFKDITSRAQGHVASKQQSQQKTQLIPRS